MQTKVYHQENILPVETGKKIAEIARREASNHLLAEASRKLVKYLVTSNESEIASRLAEAGAVYFYALEKIRYTSDPQGVELVYYPSKMYEMFSREGRWCGDCDDFSLFIMSLLISLGHETRVTLVGFSREKESYEHVFIETNIRGCGWVTVDPSTHEQSIKKTREMLSKVTQKTHFYP